MKTLFQLKEGDKVWDSLLYLEDGEWITEEKEYVTTKVSTWREYDDVKDEMRQVYVFSIRDRDGEDIEYISMDNVGIFRISKDRHIFFDENSLKEYKMWLLKATIKDLERQKILLTTSIENTIFELKKYYKHE